MPDSLPPVAKSSSDPELRPSEGSEPGTVDRLNEAPQLNPGEWCGCGEVSCGFHRALDAMRDGQPG